MGPAWQQAGRAKVPHGCWQTMTFLAALRHDRIDAPWFIEGPIDGESFRLYVKEVLSASRDVGVATRPRDLAVNRPNMQMLLWAVENACLNLMGLTAQKRQSLIKHGLPRACLVRCLNSHLLNALFPIQALQPRIDGSSRALERACDFSGCHFSFRHFNELLFFLLCPRLRRPSRLDHVRPLR
jgi:hypothetical protein